MASVAFQLEKAEQELVYLRTDKAYERTYGWSWFLKLHQELMSLGDLDQVKDFQMSFRIGLFEA
jgi:hypothetical protein